MESMVFCVILHNVRSVHNVGSIFRTADAAGAEKIYLCGITPAPHDRLGNLRKDFAKVALGAEKYVAWESVKNTARLTAALKKGGWKIFAVEQSRKSVPYDELKISAKSGSVTGGKSKNLKIALVLGDEVRGLPPSILNRAGKILEIPMRGAMVGDADHPKHSGRGKESLNVAVSFGIVAFELRHL